MKIGVVVYYLYRAHTHNDMMIMTMIRGCWLLLLIYALKCDAFFKGTRRSAMKGRKLLPDMSMSVAVLSVSMLYLAEEEVVNQNNVVR